MGAVIELGKCKVLAGSRGTNILGYNKGTEVFVWGNSMLLMLYAFITSQTDFLCTNV